MTDILFIIDELHPVRNAPSVRIENLRAAFPLESSFAVGGSSSPEQPRPKGIITIARPSEKSPIRFLLFLIRLSIISAGSAVRIRPPIIFLSVPKYELLIIAPFLAARCSHLIIDLRDSLGFLDYRAYLQHFLPRWIAAPLGSLIKKVVTSIQRRAFRSASLISVANHGIEKTINHPAVIVLPNGVDTSTFTPQKRSTRTSNTPLKLVYLGNFAEKDRFEQIIELHSLSKISFCVHLIGEGRNREKVLSNLTAAGVPFEYHGLVPHEKLPALLRTMDAGFIFRSSGVDESIPVALFEFAACGIPSLCNDTGIMAELVRSRELGFVCATTAELSSAISAISEEEYLKSSGERLHAVAKEHFSLASTRATFQLLITEILTKIAAGEASQKKGKLVDKSGSNNL
jgi:glycosyltransferase involved in cell wall biosynthesis